MIWFDTGRRSEATPTEDTDSSNKAQIFTFRELATATKNFRDETFIGQGGFGTVYKGQLDRTNQVYFDVRKFFCSCYIGVEYVDSFTKTRGLEHLFRLWLLKDLIQLVSKERKNFLWRFSCFLFYIIPTLLI